MKRNTLLPLAALGLLAGCGDQTLVAGLFLNTPAITINNPGAIPGVDAGPVTVGPYSVILGFVTTINTSDITNLSAADIAPVVGAQVTLNFESCRLPDGGPVADAGECIASGQGGLDRILTIPSAGGSADAGFTSTTDGGSDGTDGGSQDITGGLYELVSTDPSDGSNLTFETGVTYAMIFQVPNGDSFGARFKPGPPAHMKEFADKLNPVSLAVGQPLTVHRDDAQVNGQYLPAALLIGMIDPNNLQSIPQIVYKTFDYTDPKTLALFVLSDQPYRVDHFDIDASVFSASGYYVVTMISISEGPASANAFIGSVALAGSGDSGLVIVGNPTLP